MREQPGQNTRPHAWLPPSFLGMDATTCSYLTTDDSFDSQAAWVNDVRGLFLTWYTWEFVQPGTGRRPVDWCRNQIFVLYPFSSSSSWYSSTSFGWRLRRGNRCWRMRAISLKLYCLKMAVPQASLGSKALHQCRGGVPLVLLNCWGELSWMLQESSLRLCFLAGCSLLLLSFGRMSFYGSLCF